MKEKPILFSTAMVNAIIAGKKTQTRRVIKIQDNSLEFRGFVLASASKNDIGSAHFTDTFPVCRKSNFVKKPYEVGQTIWVRETFANTWTPDSNDIGFIYKADGRPERFPYWGNAKQGKDEVWIPSIYMPREAARLLLKVKDLRVERLNDISEKDAISEGLKVFEKGFVFPGTEYDEIGLCHTHASIAFSIGWDKINEKRGYGWDTNPWIWVIEFEKLDKSRD